MASTLTAEQQRRNLESLDKVWSTVRDRYWDPTLGGVDWNAAKQVALPKVRTARSMAEVRAALREMVEKLGKSHFAILPSELYEGLETDATKRASPGNTRDGSIARAAQPSAADEECAVGIEAEVVDGKALVTSVEAGSPAALAGIRMGWEIVSVEGTPMAPLISALAGIRLREHYEQTFLRGIFEGPLPEAVQAVFSDGAGNVHNRTLSRATPKGNLAKLGYTPATRVWLDASQLALPGDAGTVGYVRFNEFMDPEHLMPAFQKAVRECLRCKGFIIDLRGNPGGLGAMSLGMAGWFVSKRSRRLGTMKEREGDQDFTVNPRPETFEGPLAILVNGGSASTSEILAAGMQDLGRARVFGTRTAGAALPSQFILLPNGDGFQYAEANYISRGGKVLEGEGVTPDVTVKHTRESLLAERDAFIDAAMSWLQTAK
ncbi:MAG: S41 family peptidase [Bryobacteraceae bacterium]